MEVNKKLDLVGTEHGGGEQGERPEGASVEGDRVWREEWGEATHD